MRTRVFLNPSNNVLVGAFPADAEHIHVIHDSSAAPYTVVMPDVNSAEHKEFIHYNLPENGVGNTVRIVPVTGQEMRIREFYHDLAPLDTVGMVSDLKKRWLLSDVNH
jgi:hypothetical protein